jgi:hypothetical protein
MGLKPYINAPDVFSSGELRKSFSSGTLNKSRTLSGGGSGHRSESRREKTEATKYTTQGNVIPAFVVKTIIHYRKTESIEAEVNGEKIVGTSTTVKVLSQPKYIPKAAAFTTMPFTFKVEYKDDKGNTMTIINNNIG